MTTTTQVYILFDGCEYSGRGTLLGLYHDIVPAREAFDAQHRRGPTCRYTDEIPVAILVEYEVDQGGKMKEVRELARK